MSDGQARSSRAVIPAQTPECRWVRGAGTLWRKAGDTVVLLPETGEGQAPLVVSGSAALLWELLAHPVTLSELVAQLSAVYEVKAPEIESDLEPVLAGLHAAAA